MTTDRRASIERAWAKASRPRGLRIEGARPGQGMTLQVAAQIARSGGHRPGDMTKLLHQLPEDDRAKVREVANLYADQRDAGRHGRPDDVLEAFEVDKATAEAVVNGLEVDYVAAELQRRRGSDADRPLPELTRRDYIDAALEAHATE
jgi:hypothetical protein